MNKILAAAFGRLRSGLVPALLMACAMAGAAPLAQAQAQAPAGDPPGRAARLSDVTGQVWLYSPETNEWIGADRNQPLTTGDRIATDANGRAEIGLGTTTLRLDAGTELEIARLDDSRYVVRLQSGSVAARFRTAQGAAEFELDTDEGHFLVQAAGRYRFDRGDQASDATVYAGRATYEGRNSALPVLPGQHGQFWLDAAGTPQYSMIPSVRDAFAAWNDDRDRGEDRAATPRYVSAEMTGAEELDRYGRWEQTPDYGAVWYPAETPVDWAPYRAGHWSWVRPWGWSWVDDAPWGFAPFHYGRWVQYHERWAWSPGTYVARPVYAPALVAWVGGGGSVSVTIGGGGRPVGWFPLAPREVYVPAYRVSPGYVRNINITNVTNVTVINNVVNNVHGEGDRREYRNRAFPGAVTIVPAAAFAGRQSMAPVAARFRNDPQARSLVSDTRPGPVAFAPPVAAPPVAPRPANGLAPRPPFEGRAPGAVFGGRPPGARPGDEGRPGGFRPQSPPQSGGPVATPGAQPSMTAQPPVTAQPRLPQALPNEPQRLRPNNETPAGMQPAPGRPGEAGVREPLPGRAAEPQRPPAPLMTTPAVPGERDRGRDRDLGRERDRDRIQSRPAETPRPIGAPQVAPQAPAPAVVAPQEVRAPRGEMPRGDIPRGDVPRPDAARPEPARAPAARVDAQRVEPARSEAPRAPRVEAQRVEAPRTEAPRAPAARVEAPRPEAARVEAPKPAPAPRAEVSRPPREERKDDKHDDKPNERVR